MLDMRVYIPAEDLRPFLGAYYLLQFDHPRILDIMQAEQAQVRFGISGAYEFASDNGTVRISGATFFGPRIRPVSMAAEGPGRVLGVGLLPMGLEAVIGAPAHEMADLILPLDEVMGSRANETLDKMFFARSDRHLIALADEFFRTAIKRRPGPALQFQNIVERWLTYSEDPRIDSLIDACDRSSRQVERLTQRYFAIGPKMLSRKSRALRAATKLRLRPDCRWQDAAGAAFYDQSHFIREFNSFIGMTPNAFAQAKAPVMGPSLRARYQQRLLTPLSLLT